MGIDEQGIGSGPEVGKKRKAESRSQRPTGASSKKKGKTHVDRQEVEIRMESSKDRSDLAELDEISGGGSE